MTLQELGQLAEMTRAEFHKAPDIRCLVYFKKNLANELRALDYPEAKIETAVQDLLENFSLSANEREFVDNLDKDEFEEFIDASTKALANIIRLYQSADLPINWSTNFY